MRLKWGIKIWEEICGGPAFWQVRIVYSIQYFFLLYIPIYYNMIFAKSQVCILYTIPACCIKKEPATNALLTQIPSCQEAGIY